MSFITYMSNSGSGVRVRRSESRSESGLGSGSGSGSGYGSSPEPGHRPGPDGGIGATVRFWVEGQPKGTQRS